MYFDNSKNIAFTLPAGIWWWFLDLFELWIKSTWVDEKPNSPQDSSSEIEKDIAENAKDATSSELQTKETSLQEDIAAFDDKKDTQKDDK